MKSKYPILILFVTLFFSCSYNSEDDLSEEIIIDDFVTYDANIKSIIDNNCINCHNNPPVNGAPMPLITFDNVKQAVENRNLIGRISATDGSVMPAGGPRLPQNLIDLVIQWEQEGLLEN
ncbi:hypothetical protein [Winogradskyella flava]|uniref:Cytochrome c domain-containing protein n=1 Tax=Winogradskyella flava TaxID=1884876 RepID=A0A842IS52_9FLAO|nr:hypothetical protein [Winogradskyella flava]MBC2843708.1 hypothetical protein [Winogradskyella flava]